MQICLKLTTNWRAERGNRQSGSEGGAKLLFTYLLIEETVRLGDGETI